MCLCEGVCACVCACVCVVCVSVSVCVCVDSQYFVKSICEIGAMDCDGKDEKDLCVSEVGWFRRWSQTC